MSKNVVLLSGYKLKKEMDDPSVFSNSKQLKGKITKVLEEVFSNKHLYNLSSEQIEILERPISSLSLSIRSIHHLEKNGVFKISDLLFYDDDEIIQLTNVGEKNVKEILQIKYILEDEFHFLVTS